MWIKDDTKLTIKTILEVSKFNWTDQSILRLPELIQLVIINALSSFSLRKIKDNKAKNDEINKIMHEVIHRILSLRMPLNEIHRK